MRRMILAAFLVLCAGAALADEKLGIILMHGKEGRPDRMIDRLALALGSAGFLVDSPEMCWSKHRIYDKPYGACLDELDQAAARLKADGATAIVVAGQSLGGNAALGYGATRPVKGVVAIAAAHSPERLSNRRDVRESLDKAATMIAEGKGDSSANFNDTNVGHDLNVTATANTYVSFFAATSPAVMPANAAKLTAPLLWVAGDNDKTQFGPGYAFAKAPPHPLNRYVTVSADHGGTPDAGRDAIVDWLKELAKQ
ncbi:MAG: alpha/beta hydrolase [Rhodospirillaceae bacterium]|nr:alpha/beta hydrolase [Rhodospirillales bacterium]